LNYGVGIGGSRVLDENLVRKMSSPLVPDSVMKQDYHRWGLGVRVIISKKYPLPVGSFGWSGAYGTHFWVDPVNNITAVYMKNSLYDGGSGSVTSYIFEKDVMRSF
ncbi:MAG: serine hydrolase, partial [Clostridia bacterium]|nr:serine hydrolase [Clostridia bacterium]